MPLTEYFLLALLGSTPLATGGTVTRNFDADALTQPAGGTPSEPGVRVSASNTNKSAASSNKTGKTGHKGGKKGHKGGKKSKKSSGGSTTPPPK
jgi:hypothetical protein